MTNKHLLAAITSILLLSVICFCKAQVPEQPVSKLSLKGLMTSEEFDRAGISKLSNDELRALDAWVEKRTLAIIRIVQGQALVASGGYGAKPSWKKEQITPTVLVMKKNFGNDFVPIGQDGFSAPTWTKEQVIAMCLVTPGQFGRDFVPINHDSINPPTWRKDEVKTFVIAVQKGGDVYEATESPVLLPK